VLYRVAQAALNNVSKHTRANRVEVSLVFEMERVELKGSDNGAGFNVAAVPAAGSAGRITVTG